MPIKITIITSIYNKSKYLSDYVQSIKARHLRILRLYVLTIVPQMIL